MLDLSKIFVLPDPDEDRAILVDYYCKNFAEEDSFEDVTRRIWSRRLRRAVPESEVGDIILAFSSLAKILKEV